MIFFQIGYLKMILAQRQQQALSQKMVMSQQMINAVNLLNLSSEELQEEIVKEVKKNPALVFKSSSYVSAAALEKGDEFQNFLENIQDDSYQTLQAHLLKQARESISDEYVLNAAEIIIQNLDTNGFNYVPIEELFLEAEQQNNITKSEIKKALHSVRRFDPIGCACSGFKQSLIVQAGIICESPKTGLILDIYKNSYELIVKIIKEYYEVLSAVSDEELFIQKLTKKNIFISHEQAEETIDLLKSLTPYPGRSYSGSAEEKRFITPIAEIKRDGNEFKVVINDEEIPALEISPEYKNLNFRKTKNSSFSSQEEKEQVKEFLNRASMLMNIIEYRNRTILKILTAIVNVQYNFFAGIRNKKDKNKMQKGYLKPLRQADIAEMTGFNVSTISRAANGKYIRCEWGLFEIKDLFSNEVPGGFSKDYVLAQIEDILNLNDEQKTLSDSKIGKLLKEQGIEISTRTVNKYRKELGIASSYYRAEKN